MSINEFADGDLITAPRMNEMVDQLNTRYYVVDQSVGRTVKVWDYLNDREQMVYGDTGERDVTAGLSPHKSGKLILSRHGSMVQLELQDLVFQDAAAGFVKYNAFLPAGFRPKSTYVWFNTVAQSSAADVSPFRVGTYGDLVAYGVKANETQAGLFTWRTSEPWPTSLPGVAA